MARVRPGVDETFASFEPRSALISEDLPTLERPRKAISGASDVRAASGKCSGATAERRNFGTSRILNRLTPLARASRYNEHFGDHENDERSPIPACDASRDLRAA